MSYTFLREKALVFSGYLWPWLLAIAFAAGDFHPSLGADILVPILLWFLLWNFRAILFPASEWRIWLWPIIGFFAILACKDCILWLMGFGTFKAFAKAGSRIISIAGAAALMTAYPPKKFLSGLVLALGLYAACIAAVTFMIWKDHALRPLLNANTFGMAVSWFIIYVVFWFFENDKKIPGMLSAIIGLGFVLTDSLWGGLDNSWYNGSRTAPFALAAGLVFCLIGNKKTRRVLLILLIACALVGLVAITIVPSDTMNSLLAHRPLIWRSYAELGMSRPILGWGYTDEVDNRRILAQSTDIFMTLGEDFVHRGYGPHNSFMTMFFENGALAALCFAVLLFARATRPNNRFIDACLGAYIVFISTDAIMPGGITFLGFFFGLCILGMPRPESDNAAQGGL